MSTFSVPTLVEELLTASGGRGMTLAELRGQRGGFSVHVSLGARRFTVIDGGEPA